MDFTIAGFWDQYLICGGFVSQGGSHRGSAICRPNSSASCHWGRSAVSPKFQLLQFMWGRKQNVPRLAGEPYSMIVMLLCSRKSLTSYLPDLLSTHLITESDFLILYSGFWLQGSSPRNTSLHSWKFIIFNSAVLARRSQAAARICWGTSADVRKHKYVGRKTTSIMISWSLDRGLLPWRMKLIR